MPAAKKILGRDPVPRYIMPDASIPPYDEMLKHLKAYPRSYIGSSYYYVRAEHDCAHLCRILPGGGKIYFHEIVDHEKYGISDQDMKDAIRPDAGSFSLPDCYPISSRIGEKLLSAFVFR